MNFGKRPNNIIICVGRIDPYKQLSKIETITFYFAKFERRNYASVVFLFNEKNAEFVSNMELATFPKLRREDSFDVFIRV
jgi:hypothetical protein